MDDLEARLRAMEEKLDALMAQSESTELEELIDEADVPDEIHLRIPEGTTPRRVSLDLVIMGGSRPRRSLVLDLGLMGGSRDRPHEVEPAGEPAGEPAVEQGVDEKP